MQTVPHLVYSFAVTPDLLVSLAPGFRRAWQSVSEACV